MQYDRTHRKVSPARESVGSDLYTVVRYDPLAHTCDLTSASINQRGDLKEVPIACGFGGAWEFQSQHQPAVGSVNQQQWGNCARGARWGVAYPIQPGDLCRVMYAGESQSDPMITEFYRQQGDYGIPWVANQVLSSENDYTKNTPLDDDEPELRYDLLLPSGAWLRSLKSGSWVVATAPVDRPKAYIVLDANGTIKIKARSTEDYKVHLEFDPEKEEGRICIGSLEGGSHIEFKDGDITIKAKRNIKIQGQRVDGDIKPQKTPAVDALQSMTAAEVGTTPTREIAKLTNQAAGEAVINGALTPEPSKPGAVVVKPEKKDIISNLIANPAIDGAVRGKIGDLLTDPAGMVESALSGFKPGMGGLPMAAIADNLLQTLGANALSGNLGDITSALDFSKLTSELGIPSWIGEALNGQSLNLDSLLDRVPELLNLPDSPLLSELLKHAGDFAMQGANGIDAKALLESAIAGLPGEFDAFKERATGLLENLDTTPVATPKGENGQTDWLNTGAQRLGAHILRGNTMLGGRAKLFDLEQIKERLGGDAAAIANVEQAASQIENFFSNPHELIEFMPDEVAPHMETLAKLPQEVLGILKNFKPDQLAKFPEILRTVQESQLPGFSADAIEQAFESFNVGNFANLLEGQFGRANLIRDSVAVDIGHQAMSGLPPELSSIASTLANLPGGVQDLLKQLPQQLFSFLSKMPLGEAQKLLDNPASFVQGVDTDLLKTVFGSGFSKAAGVFDMKVSKIAKFNVIPKTSDSLRGLNEVTEFHLQTFGNPIEKYQEYGVLEMPDFWSAQPDGSSGEG